MKALRKNLKDLIDEDGKLTFLAGAGISIDPPSCLPAGSAMIKRLVEYFCAKSSIDLILNINELRFEQLVQIISDVIDPELKVIKYYSKCTKPNINHFFLAEMIMKGQVVITTNFDNLIEHSLIQLNKSMKNVVPVITKEDFMKYNDPEILYKQNKYPIYKVHGSYKNIVENQSTRESLITTIKSLISNRKGVNLFQIEPKKKNFFEKVSINHSLIIMGYSGSDDFDILPTLKILKGLNQIIWINHINDDNGNETIYEINKYTSRNLNKIDNILYEISLMKNVNKIYRVDGNTSRIVKSLISIKTELCKENFELNPITFFKKNIKKPDQFHKKLISYKIFNNFNLYENAEKCLKDIIEISEEDEHLKWKSLALTYLGEIYRKRSNYNQALKLYKLSLNLCNRLNYIEGKATLFNNIGVVEKLMGNYNNAIRYYKEALKIYKNLDNDLGIAGCNSNIGSIYQSQGMYERAIKRFEKTLELSIKIGDSNSRIASMINLADSYNSQGRYKIALKYLEQTLKLCDLLSNLPGKSTCLNNLSQIYRLIGEVQMAIEMQMKALKINKILGDKLKKATYLCNIGSLYSDIGETQKALKFNKEALSISERINDMKIRSNCLNNIGLNYEQMGDYKNAMEFYEKALKISELRGDLPKKALNLINIGGIYKLMHSYDIALRYCRNALKISKQIESLEILSYSLNNIGSIYNFKGNQILAIKNINKAFKITEILGDLKGQASCLNYLGEIYQSQGNHEKALQFFKNALSKVEDFKFIKLPILESIKKNIDLIESDKDLLLEINDNEKKIGRNHPCFCGSGKKYKKCCGKNSFNERNRNKNLGR
ncbi:MAG: tetratricopeptide repeat protein [Candidatus Hermodarchaeota archaeon]